MTQYYLRETLTHEVENTANRFMEAWRNSDAISASKLVQRTYAFEAAKSVSKWHLDKRRNKPPRPPMTLNEELRAKFFDPYKLVSWGLVSTNILSTVMADVDVLLILEKTEVTLRVRLIKEKGPYQPRDDGEWGVNPSSLSRIVRTKLREVT